MAHLLEHGQLIHSPGCHFTYRVVGPCCRLFDRDQLPWPCCRLEWHGKEPSWRRIGRQLVVDMGTQNSPSYAVEIVGQARSPEPLVVTLYYVKLPLLVKEWWYSTKPQNQAIAPPRLEAIGR
jgi:hypothetical protein